MSGVKKAKVISRNRITKEQIEYFISYMEEHSLFARGQMMKLGPQGHITYKTMWSELAVALNSIGACIKDVEGWQETWKNLKKNAKHNKVHYLKALHKTGHENPNTQLKEEDERICSIYGKHGLGLNITPEMGFKTTTNLRKSLKGISIVNHYQVDFSGPDVQKLNDVRSRISTKSVSITENYLDLSSLHDDESKKTTRLSMKHTDYIITFMENYPRLANEELDQLSENNLYIQLQLQLQLQGCTKTVKGLKKCWIDLKRNARQSAMDYMQGKRSQACSSQHSRIINLVGYDENTCYDNKTTEATQENKVSPSTELGQKRSILTAFPTANASDHVLPKIASLGLLTSSNQQTKPLASFTSANPTVFSRFGITGQNNQEKLAFASSLNCDVSNVSSISQGCTRVSTSTSLNCNNLYSVPSVIQNSPISITTPSTTNMMLQNSFCSAKVAPISNEKSNTVSSQKAKLFIDTLNEKGELVQHVADKIIDCFKKESEKQRETIKSSFTQLSNTLISDLSAAIAKEFEKSVAAIITARQTQWPQDDSANVDNDIESAVKVIDAPEKIDENLGQSIYTEELLVTEQQGSIDKEESAEQQEPINKEELLLTEQQEFDSDSEEYEVEVLDEAILDLLGHKNFIH